MSELIEEWKGKLPEYVLKDFEAEAEKKKLTQKEMKTCLEEIKKRFEESKISPGEAIGIITAESFGEPGTQMSVATNEPLILKIDNKIKIIEAGKFIDNLMCMKGSFKLNIDSEILPLND